MELKQLAYHQRRSVILREQDPLGKVSEAPSVITQIFLFVAFVK